MTEKNEEQKIKKDFDVFTKLYMDKKITFEELMEFLIRL
jgi:hypothetical protein